MKNGKLVPRHIWNNAELFLSDQILELWSKDGLLSPDIKVGWHRIDGPAIIYENSNAWWIDDCYYPTLDSIIKSTILTGEEITFLILKYGYF